MKKNLIKMITCLSIVGVLGGICTEPVQAAWKRDKTGWWYAEGSSWATGWRQIDGKFYYFYDNGYMAHNTQIDGFNLDGNGAMSKSYAPVLNIDDFDYDISQNYGGENVKEKNIIQYWSNDGFINNGSWAASYIYNSKEDKDLKTKRNITIGSSLDQVFKAYGSAGLKTVEKNDRFYNYPDHEKNPLIKYVEYGMKDGYYNDLITIRIYFDSSNTVQVIAYTLNYPYMPINGIEYKII